MVKWAVAILKKEDHILIGQLKERTMTMPNMTWYFPFTELKENESPRKAIKRIFEEDFNLDVEVDKLIDKYVPSENPKLTQYIYLVKYKGGSSAISKSMKDMTWIKPTQITKYLTNFMSKSFMEYLEHLEKGKEFEFY